MGIDLLRCDRLRWWRQGCAALIAAALAACGGDVAEPRAALSVTTLAQATDDTPAGLSCEASAAGQGLNGAQGAVNIGAMRVRLSAQGETVEDRSVEILGQLDSLRLERLSPGSSYELGVSACRLIDGPATWVGSLPSVQVRAGEVTEATVTLLPDEGFACAAEQPAAPSAFAAAASLDGESVVIAGGLQSWTGQGQAVATDQVLRFVDGRFAATAARLPEASAMAQSVTARPAPGLAPAMVLVGGASAIVEGADSLNGDLLSFGPAQDATVGGAVWVEVRGDEVEVRAEDAWPLQRRFGAGVAVVPSDGGDLILVAGGVVYGPNGADVASSAELVRLSDAGPVVTEVALAAPRVGPSIVALDATRFLIVGGNTGSQTPLAELVDVGGQVPVSQPLEVVPDPMGEAPGESLRPSAFATTLPVDGGVIVIGGLPIISEAAPGALPVAVAAISPVLYRLSWAGATPGQLLVSQPEVSGGEVAALSQRVFPTALDAGGGEVWLMGGVGADVGSPFLARSDSLRVDLNAASLEPLAPSPYHAVGASAVRLWDGAALLFGGIVELANAPGQLAPTRTAVLRRGTRAPLTCAQPSPDLSDPAP